MQQRVGVHESLVDGETIFDSSAISFKQNAAIILQ
jgi:hypothetical protein